MSQETARPHAVVACQHEVWSVSHLDSETRLQRLSDSVSDPLVGMTRHGAVVIVESSQITVYEKQSAGYRQHSVQTSPFPFPFAIVPSPQPDQLLIGGKAGHLHIIQIR